MPSKAVARRGLRLVGELRSRMLASMRGHARRLLRSAQVRRPARSPPLLGVNRHAVQLLIAQFQYHLVRCMGGRQGMNQGARGCTRACSGALQCRPCRRAKQTLGHAAALSAPATVASPGRHGRPRQARQPSPQPNPRAYGSRTCAGAGRGHAGAGRHGAGGAGQVALHRGGAVHGGRRGDARQLGRAGRLVQVAAGTGAGGRQGRQGDPWRRRPGRHGRLLHKRRSPGMAHCSLPLVLRWHAARGAGPSWATSGLGPVAAGLGAIARRTWAAGCWRRRPCSAPEGTPAP